MTPSRSTTRAVRMFAAVNPQGDPEIVQCTRDEAAKQASDLLRVNWRTMHDHGWRIVPVTVSINARATLSPTDSTEDA